MFRKIVNQHTIQVGLNYVCNRITKTEYQCAMEYFKLLNRRLEKHYTRLYERN